MIGVEYNVSENIIQYVIGAAGGDTDSMAKFYSKTLKSSYFLAEILCNSSEDATEITKSAYAKAFCSFDKLKRPEAYEMWMKQNIAEAFKEKATFVFSDAQGGAQAVSTEFLPENVFEDEELSSKIIEAVSKLETERKTALVLHYNNGMPPAAVAKFLGVSESTANSLLCKARGDVLASAGIVPSQVSAVGELPVLTRIFMRAADALDIDGETVREIFAFAFEAYEASKPEETEAPAEEETAEPVLLPVPEASENEETGESPEESPIEAAEEVPEEPVEIGEESLEAFERIKMSVAGLSEITDVAQDETDKTAIPVTGHDSTINALNSENKDGVLTPVKTERKPAVTTYGTKKKKINVKALIAILAVLAVVIVAVVLIVKGSGNNPDNPDPSDVSTTSSEAVLPEVKWLSGIYAGYSDITYLNEKYCSFKSAETAAYGLMDYEGEIVLNPNYDGFSVCSAGRDYSGAFDYHILAEIDGKDYLVMTNPDTGAVTVSDSVHDDDHDPAGELVLPEGAEYDEIDRTYEGYAAVKKDGLWGYITVANGKLVIPYEYETVNTLNDHSASDYCRGFDSGLVAVKKGGKMGIVNLENQAVVPFEYDNILQGKGGVFIAEKDGAWGAILVGNAIDKFLNPVDDETTQPETTNELTTEKVTEDETTEAKTTEVQTTEPETQVTTTEPETTEEETTEDSGSDDVIGTYIVRSTAGTGANVRADAGSEFDIVGYVANGKTVKAYDSKKASTGVTWVQIIVDGEKGWVSTNQLKKAD